MRYPENAIFFFFFFELAFRIAISSLHPPYLTDTRINRHVLFREFIRSATGYSFFQVGQWVKAKPDSCSLQASVSVSCPVSVLVLHSSSLRTLQWTIFGFTSQWNSYNHFVDCLVRMNYFASSYIWENVLGCQCTRVELEPNHHQNNWLWSGSTYKVARFWFCKFLEPVVMVQLLNFTELHVCTNLDRVHPQLWGPLITLWQTIFRAQQWNFMP